MLSPQTRSIQSRFLQSRNLNCIALCEGARPRGVAGDGQHPPPWLGTAGGLGSPAQCPGARSLPITLLTAPSFPRQSSPPRTCRSTATSGSAPSRTTSAPASSLCEFCHLSYACARPLRAILTPSTPPGTKTAKWETPISILRTPKSRRRSCV